jgi:hypothetical protein
MYFGVWVNKLHGIASKNTGKLIINALGILRLRRQVKTEGRGEMVLRKHPSVRKFVHIVRSSF